MNPASMKRDVPVAVREAVMFYLSERLAEPVISMSGVLKSVREKVPECSMSDQNLLELAAEKATEAGFAVSFDGDEMPA